MGEVSLLLIVGAVAALIVGSGLGFCFASYKFAADLSGAIRESQDLQRQLNSLNAKLSTTEAHSVATSGERASIASQTIDEQKSRQIPASDVAASQAQTSPAATSLSAVTVANDHEPISIGALQGFVNASATNACSGMLLIVDIDFLRQFSERYGQQLGQYVVNHVERVLGDSLLAHDAVISRYEGEEFVINVPLVAGEGTERLLAARNIARQLCADVQTNYLQVGSERLALTVSVGTALAEINLPGEQLIARADEALDAAKKAGRNRCYVHTGTECLPIDAIAEVNDRRTLDSATENTLRKAASVESRSGRRVSNGDRRRHERKPCHNINLIAPCTDGVLPEMALFQRVQFFDISVSGFSMVVPTFPATDHFAVALINSHGMIFMSAEVANVRQQRRANATDKPLLIVGCRFRHRLYPASQSTHTAASLAGK